MRESTPAHWQKFWEEADTLELDDVYGTDVPETMNGDVCRDVGSRWQDDVSRIEGKGRRSGFFKPAGEAWHRDGIIRRERYGRAFQRERQSIFRRLKFPYQGASLLSPHLAKGPANGQRGQNSYKDRCCQCA